MAHFLGSFLVSWGTKKKNLVALSTAEAEYVVVATYCARVLWIKQQLEDFDVNVDCIPILCDKISAMNIAKNPVHHKRTKHIDVRHHFFRDSVEKGHIIMKFCKTENQVADIFTKALGREAFEKNRIRLEVMQEPVLGTIE